MAQNEASSCISQIDDAERRIAEYNANWNIWDIEYKRLDNEITNKETEINNKDTELYNWVISELQNNWEGVLLKGGYNVQNRNGCGNWPGDECSITCRNNFINTGSYTTPRGRRPLSIDHYHTYMQHCSWTLPASETYRCYCKAMKGSSASEFNSRAAAINQLIIQKTNLQNTKTTHSGNMPQFPPITVKCCDKVIECNNKIYGPNACYGNLQICKQSNFNILDKSRTTELENANKTKIIKIKNDLVPVTEQIKELLKTMYTISRQVSSLIDINNISKSIIGVKEIYDRMSKLMASIETIRNINNIENEAKELFNYITADTTHKREMQAIFQTISTDVNIIKSLILQAKETFSNIKIIYETLLNEELNFNLLKIEQNKILASINKLNDYLDRLKIMNDTVNSSTISSQEDIDKFLEIYNKAIILVKNINLEIKDLNNFKNELINIFNKFTINSFLINNVKDIYNDTITKVGNILNRINDFRIDIIIENMYKIFINNKNIYDNNLIKLDEEKLKIIQDEELNKIKIINNQITDDKLIVKTDDNKKDNIIKNNIKQEETTGINIIYIIIGIVIALISIIFLFIKK